MTRRTPAATPGVTVAICFLNEARFLEGAVQTVLAQTFPEWELLLVDDGSTDASVAIAESHASRDPGRIRLLRHPGGRNAGLPASRNLALLDARAPLLCYLDADDRWSPRKLEHQRDVLAAYPDAVMLCGPSWHQDEDRPGEHVLVPVWRKAPAVLGRGRLARLMVRGAVRTPPPSDVMYRTQALRRVGGVPPGSSVIEDQRTYVATSLGGSVVVTDEPLTTYLVRRDSLYGSQHDDPMAQVREYRAFEDWVLRFCYRRGHAGVAVAATVLAHRLQRGLQRRARDAAHRLITRAREWTGRTAARR